MKKTYFASDFHLGVDTNLSSKAREKLVVSWLDEIKKDAEALFLLGDIFDYWFEYKEVVPKGFTRLLGKLGEMVDSGIRVEWYTGNHDMWTFGYLEAETGVTIQKVPCTKDIHGKICYLAHGDGLAPVDKRYKIIKWVLSNSFIQFLFSLIPSRIGLFLMKNLSIRSRHSQHTNEKYEVAMEQKLIAYSESLLKNNGLIHYFIYGHRHRPRINELSNKVSKYINLGDWTDHFSYGVMDKEGNFELKKYRQVRVGRPRTEDRRSRDL